MKQNLIVGVGNRDMGDDAVGLLVAERLEEDCPDDIEIRKSSGEPGELIELFEQYTSVYLVDALKAEEEPGSLVEINVHEDELPTKLFPVSTHSFGVYEAIKLARRLQALPENFKIYGITGTNFSPGDELSAPVSDSVDKLVAELKKVFRANNN
ncbi:MAG: hydrogenase maturation protease [bacterium]